MSRCPPPLGPMSWAGRSSICRASSPTVSVLPRQARPHWQKRSIKRGAGLAGLGDTLGSMAPRVRAGMEEGIEECGQRQQVSGWEQVNDTAVVQLLFPQPLPSAQAAGGADRCAREGPVQDTGPCHPCCSRFVCNGVGIRAFCLPSSLALLLPFSLSVSSSSFPSFFVLFLLCSLAWC